MTEVPELLDPVLRGLILTSLAMLWTVGLVRAVGLRSFSKMTATDFVATIATGSLIAQAGTRAELPEFLQSLAAITGVFVLQWLLAKVRQKWKSAEDFLTNEPVLLMDRGAYLEEAMAQTRVSRANILEKLRSAGVTDLARVQAVVLETTGDISVITGERLDNDLMDGVRRL